MSTFFILNLHKTSVFVPVIWLSLKISWIFSLSSNSIALLRKVCLFFFVKNHPNVLQKYFGTDFTCNYHHLENHTLCYKTKSQVKQLISPEVWVWLPLNWDELIMLFCNLNLTLTEEKYNIVKTDTSEMNKLVFMMLDF